MIVNLLRERPGLRSTAYLASMVAVLLSSRRLHPRSAVPDSGTRLLLIHLTASGPVAVLTGLFIALRPEDRARWQGGSPSTGLIQFAAGAGLSTTALLALLAAAETQGWVVLHPVPETPGTRAALLRTLVVQLAHLSVAANEEVIFRGYGLQTLTQAIGRPGAVAVLSALFALAHGPGGLVFVGQGTFGLALTALHLWSRSLWLPIGYHFAWNYLQMAVVGHPDRGPTLRPLALVGPKQWVGDFGTEKTGLLEAAINTTVVLAVGAVMWWQRRQVCPHGEHHPTINRYS